MPLSGGLGLVAPYVRAQLGARHATGSRFFDLRGEGRTCAAPLPTSSDLPEVIGTRPDCIGERFPRAGLAAEVALQIHPQNIA
jgi:hypothetical protein